MKKLLLRFLTIVVYLIALLWITEFKLWILIDIKAILMLIFGTALLTISCYKKGMSVEDLRAAASWNAMLTAYLTTFVLLFSRLSGSQNTDHLLYDVAMNCRPLLYGLIINILLRSDSGYNKADQMVEQVVVERGATEQPPDAKEQFRLMSRDQGLTEREIQIALNIIHGQSNKEIAQGLFISESTVKKHTTNLYKKLNISNREQLKQCFKELEKSE